MKWYTYYALKQLFPSRKKISFFSLMSIIGVAIGVMVLFVVQSVMSGFQERIKHTIVETQGDIRVDSNRIIYNSDNLNFFLNSFKEVSGTAKYAYGIVMLKHDNRPVFPVVKGIDLENEPKVVPLKKFIKEGNLDDFNDDSIVLSSELARQINAAVGDELEIYSPKMLENIDSSEVMLPKTLTVIAIYETGYHQADSNIAMVTLETMQDLYGLECGIHGISIKLHPEVQSEKFSHTLNKTLALPLRAVSWQEMNADFLFALQTEKTMMNFVLIFILLISAFSITGSLTTSVVRKTREIGLIQALGGTSRQCAISFAMQGLVIGTIGGIFGISAGLLILRFRNQIIQIFTKLCGIKDFMLKFYSFADMPAHYSTWNIFAILLFAIAMCCLATILPAVKASKIQPAEALRNE